jgi:phage terminase Nu1 subunit (DNA packaging protein)
MPTSNVHVVSKLLNITPRRLQQLAADAVIPRPQRGHYDVAGAVAGYTKYLQEVAFGRGTTDLRAEQGRLVRARADLAELDLNERRQGLVPADELERALTWFITSTRSRLLALPRQVALRVVPQDPRELEAALDREIRSLLEELASDTSLPPWFDENGEANTPPSSERAKREA